MKWRALFVLAVGFLVAADKPKDDAVKKEMKKLEGTWKVVSLEMNGNKFSEEQLNAVKKMVIKGNKYTIHLANNEVTMTFKVDPSKKPKAIDSTYEDQNGETVKAKGIYELKGDTLKVCRTTKTDAKRPTKFASKADSGLILVVYKRAKS